MSETLDSKSTHKRQRWMGLLARAETAELEAGLKDLAEIPVYEFLRPPETGLVMVRGRTGGSGQPFNMGEATVTRCSVRLSEGGVGHGYVAGRDKRHAELAALFDALMQDDVWAAENGKEIIAPVEVRLQSDDQDLATKTAATKVNFFTLVRGEDEC